MSELKRNFPAVDVFKMICAILVMMIHTKPFENLFWIDSGIGMVTRFAVPFFFTISGYFLFKKVQREPSKKWKDVSRYLLRLFRFYVIWYVIFRLVDGLLSRSFQSIEYYIRHFFFTSDGSPLWFVNALIWAVIMVSVLTSCMRTKIVFCIGILLLISGYSASTMLGVTGDTWITQTLKPITSLIGVQNGLFFAFPYVAMGAYLSEQNLKVDHRKNFFGATLFFALLGAESLVAVMKFNAPLTFLWLSALPMTWFVAKLTLTIELPDKPVYHTLRKISTLFYVLHVVVFKILQKVIVVWKIHDPANLLLTVITFLITSVVAYVILLLSKRKHTTWLKYAM